MRAFRRSKPQSLDSNAPLTDAELAEMLQTDPYHKLTSRFFDGLHDVAPGRALEIGSRNRSGITRRELLPSTWDYVGFDIVPGENVDLVGDAHSLTDAITDMNFDAVIAFSVFEHLLMPWKAVIEINRVLRPGGLVFFTSHQTWPIHEYPWDFFRYSDQAWHGLLNAYTGFEVIEAVMGEPASVHPNSLHGPTIGLDQQPACLASAVMARKIAETELSWDVPLREILRTEYPH